MSERVISSATPSRPLPSASFTKSPSGWGNTVLSTRRSPLGGVCVSGTLLFRELFRLVTGSSPKTCSALADHHHERLRAFSSIVVAPFQSVAYRVDLGKHTVPRYRATTRPLVGSLKSPSPMLSSLPFAPANLPVPPTIRSGYDTIARSPGSTTADVAWVFSKKMVSPASVTQRGCY